MKNSLLAGIIVLGCSAYAQEYTAENTQQNNVLYRGFKNKLSYGQTGCPDKSYEMETVNCDLSEVKATGAETMYIVKTKSSARTAVIRFTSNGNVMDSTVFAIQNLPVPSLYWGDSKTGTTTSDLTELSVQYPPGVTLPSNFEIVSWTCSPVDTDTVYTSPGNVLSDAFMNYVKTMSKGESIVIQVNVKGEDGIIRQLAGDWVK